MRQTYMKPKMIVERFALSQSITASCAGVTPGMAFDPVGPQQWSASTCVWQSGSMQMFILNQNCSFGPEVGEEFEYEGYCYNNPTTGMSMFSSG